MPSNINYLFNFGIILVIILIIQILSGILLVFFFINLDDFIFVSLNHLYYDVFFGVILRNIHCIGANLFFLFLFLHIFKSYFYSNSKNLKVSLVGILIFFCVCGAAFLGYVLPWGQMSFWGATVITSLFSVLPYSDIFLFYIWGDFSVSNVTLLRFFSLHYLLPILTLVLVILHFNFLHTYGSSATPFVNINIDFVLFLPFYMIIDIFGIIFIMFIFLLILFFFPYYFFEIDNFIMANSLVTPLHIKPEWYYLPFYAILRVFTSKAIGVLMLLVSLLSLFTITILNKNLRLLFNINFYFISFFVGILMILVFCGGSTVAFPFTLDSDVFTFLFFIILFFYFLINYSLVFFFN